LKQCLEAVKNRVRISSHFKQAFDLSPQEDLLDCYLDNFPLAWAANKGFGLPQGQQEVLPASRVQEAHGPSIWAGGSHKAKPCPTCHEKGLPPDICNAFKGLQLVIKPYTPQEANAGG